MMPIYRFYNIKKDGHIGGPAAQHELADDTAALLEAKQALADLDVEIWQGTRVVGYLKAPETAAANIGTKTAARPEAAPVTSRS